MSTTTPTTPIPNRLPAPNPAPNRPSECPRCGTPAISTRGVGVHDLWHRQEDDRNRRLDTLMDALETMLAAFDGDPGDEHDGEPKTFRAWVQETDHILDTLSSRLEELQQATPAGDVAEIEVLPWPGDPGPAAEEDETAEPDDSTPPANPAEPVLAQPVGVGSLIGAPELDDDLGEDYIDHPATSPARF